MAKWLSEVRFKDGLIMYAIYNGTVEIMRPRLYATRDKAHEAWDEPAHYDHATPKNHKSEEVIIKPIADCGDDSLNFVSRADRTLMLITGNLDNHDAKPPAGQQRTYSLWLPPKPAIEPGQPISAVVAQAGVLRADGSIFPAEELRKRADGQRYFFEEESMSLIYRGPAHGG